MDLGLVDKVALVLASSKGLGLACAKSFYQEGAHVVICSRSKANLHKAREEIETLKTLPGEQKLLDIVVDLREENQIKTLIDSVLAKFGKIDILIHNAGGPPSAQIDQITKEQWNEAINLNLMSFIKTCKAVIPIMVKQQHGKIIAITSVSIKQPLENLVLSNTTRLGVLGFAKTLANEYAKDNILVNVVCPGPTLTTRMKELIKNQVKDSGKSEEVIKQNWINSIPLGRLGKPEELAYLVVFLASEKASYITGTAIQVDGGFVKGIL